ncbi:hypothetical protein YB2330_005796 [Saitoella coloradoensis]
MSDNDDFMMDDDETYDFDYEDDDDDEQGDEDVDIENMYYNAKAIKEDDPEAAIEEFRKVVEKEKEEGQKGDWGFKALKQIIKLSFLRGDKDSTFKDYKELLTYTKSAVTRNYSEKSLNNILDRISSSPTLDTNFMERFYSTTLESLQEAKNDRLFLKTNLKLAKLWLDRGEWGRLNKSLKGLHAALAKEGEEGLESENKGTYLLEVYALEIQMYTATKNNKKLKDLYYRTLHVKSAIPHPRIMGVIRECGGKMHMNEKQWQEAQTDFFESFRNYDEAGSLQRIQVLKYLVLATMLAQSDINPFDSQETKPYQSHPEITAMTSLVNAYQRNELDDFQRILRQNKTTIMSDPFIRAHIDSVLRNIQTSVLLALIKPYTRVTLASIAAHLKITVGEVEELCVGLILDARIQGRMDGVRGVLEMEREKGVERERYEALRKVCESVAGLTKTAFEGLKVV